MKGTAQIITPCFLNNVLILSRSFVHVWSALCSAIYQRENYTIHARLIRPLYAGLETDVVNEPLSTYVPLKYQSSAPVPSLPWRGNRRTPRCQSAPLEDVLVEKGPAVLVSGSDPVECQKATVLAEKSYGTRSQRLPLCDGGKSGRTYNLIGDVVPHVSDELDLPLALSAYHPLQVGVARSALAVDPAILELREVALEEGDLVLVGRAGHIGGAALDAEVVVYFSACDGGLGLGDELCAPHVAVPLCGVVDGDLDTLLAAGICGVLVRGREVDVFCYVAGAVDIVLVGADLVCP